MQLEVKFLIEEVGNARIINATEIRGPENVQNVVEELCIIQKTHRPIGVEFSRGASTMPKLLAFRAKNNFKIKYESFLYSEKETPEHVQRAEPA